MKTLYPTPTHLSVLLKILVNVAQREEQRIAVDFQPLDSVQCQKLVRDLPLYCDSAVLRLNKADDDAVDVISRFRLGKSKGDLQAMETVIGILLDRKNYEKSPFSEQKLANVLSEFLWHFKERLDFEVWQLLENTFDMQFVILKDDLPFLKKYMEQITEKLLNLSGPIPFYSLEKTQRYLRSKLREYSQHHAGIVSLKREILEEQLRQEHDLQHDEYIPFYESLFVAWNKHGLPLLDVSAEAISFEAMVVPDTPEIRYDNDAHALCIREEIVKLAANAIKQRHLAAVIAQESSLGHEWTYDQIVEEVDNVTPTDKLRESYDNAAYQLNESIRKKTGMKDFLLKTNKTVKINPQYLV